MSLSGRRALRFAAAALVPFGLAAPAPAGAPASWFGALPDGVAQPAVPSGNPMSRAKVALGRRLFHDADLSINGTLSCATCHDPAQSFQDGNRVHPGARGEPGLRNVPSLLNVGWLSPLTWGDPTLTTLEAQALVPLTGEDPREMGMKGQEAELARRLSANPCYRKLFRRAFPETEGRIDFASVAKALAAFQRTIVSYDTAWDRARAGGPPLADSAREGEDLFRKTCASCHAGPRFTDMAFHRIESTGPALSDQGLARSTGDARDAGRFRTPSLRDVALTAPYLHDGSAASLGEAIARHGIGLPPARMAQVIAFLGALSDRGVSADARFGNPGPRCDTAK